MSNDEDLNDLTNPLLSASEEEEYSVRRNSVKNSQRSSLFAFNDMDSGCQEDENFEGENESKTNFSDADDKYSFDDSVEEMTYARRIALALMNFSKLLCFGFILNVFFQKMLTIFPTPYHQSLITT